jgi:4'-phosphopantetheinyl transferase
VIAWHLAGAADAVAPNARWLPDAELRRAAAFEVAKRRADWLLGRLAAKRVVRRVLADGGRSVPMQEIEIASRASGAPYARSAGGEELPVSLSISHAAGHALAAAADAGALGVDVEPLEPRSREFVADFLAPEEAAAARGPFDATVVWSAKEAVLKALGVGLSADSRDVVCTGGRLSEAWEPFVVELRGGLASRPRVAGRWRRAGGLVLTFACVLSGEGGIRDLDRELHREAA